MKTTFKGLVIITFLLAGISFSTAGAQAVKFQVLLAAAKEEAKLEASGRSKTSVTESGSSVRTATRPESV